MKRPGALVLASLLVAASFWLLYSYRIDKMQSSDGKPGVEVADIGPETLRQLLTEGHPMVVEFFTANSPDCDKMETVLSRLAAAYGEQMIVAKVNAEKYPSLAAEYGVEVFPTVIFFDSAGSKRSSLNGYLDYDPLVQIIGGLNLTAR